jgi:hypothetical protein
MENYFKSSASIIRLSIYVLSKPASLLCFVDPSLNTHNQVKAAIRCQQRSIDGRSTG